MTPKPEDFAACDEHEKAYPRGGRCPDCEPEYLGCGAKGCIIERPRGQHVGTCCCLDDMDPDRRGKLRTAIARGRADLEMWKTRARRYEQHMADNVPPEHWPEMNEP